MFDKQIVVELGMRLCAGINREFPPDTVSASSAKAPSQFWILSESQDGATDGTWVMRRDYEARFFVQNGLGISPDVCHDHREAYGHTFKNDIRESFFMRGQQSEVGGSKQAGNVVALVKKLNVLGNTLVCREAFERGP